MLKKSNINIGPYLGVDSVELGVYGGLTTKRVCLKSDSCSTLSWYTVSLLGTLVVGW